MDRPKMRWLFGEHLISILSNFMIFYACQTLSMQKQDETSNTNNFSTHFLHTLRIPVILGKSKDLKLAKCSSHGIPWHLGPKSEFRNAYDDVTWWQRQCWSVCFTWISVKHLKKPWFGSDFASAFCLKICSSSVVDFKVQLPDISS